MIVLKFSWLFLFLFCVLLCFFVGPGANLNCVNEMLAVIFVLFCFFDDA